MKPDNYSRMDGQSNVHLATDIVLSCLAVFNKHILIPFSIVLLLTNLVLLFRHSFGSVDIVIVVPPAVINDDMAITK